MEPFLKNGDHNFNKSSILYLFKNPSINDIVAFKDTIIGKVLIKRIARN